LRKVTQRSFETRKKRLDTAAMIHVDAVQLSALKKRARETFIVLFELGGCDLTDLYFFKKRNWLMAAHI
jgi:hypothetical protein